MRLRAVLVDGDDCWHWLFRGLVGNEQVSTDYVLRSVEERVGRFSDELYFVPPTGVEFGGLQRLIFRGGTVWHQTQNLGQRGAQVGAVER